MQPAKVIGMAALPALALATDPTNTGAVAPQKSDDPKSGLTDMKGSSCSNDKKNNCNCNCPNSPVVVYTGAGTQAKVATGAVAAGMMVAAGLML